WIDDVLISGTPSAPAPAALFSEGFEGDVSGWTFSTTDVTTSDLTGNFGPAGALIAPKEGKKALLFPMMMQATTMSAITPILDLSSSTHPVLKLFLERIAQDGASSPTNIVVTFYESTNKNTWTKVLTDPMRTLTGTDKTWTEQSVKLNKSSKYVKIEVACATAAFNVLAIDELSISEAPAPTGLSTLSESFENAVPPTDWTMPVGTANGIWERTDGKFSDIPMLAPQSVKDGSFAATFKPTAGTEGSAILVSPLLDLTAHKAPTLSFWYWNKNAQPASTLTISISTDGSTYTTLGSVASSSDKEWERHEYALLPATKYVKLEVAFNARGGHVWSLIDNLSITATPPEIALTSLTEGFESTFPPKNWKLKTNRTDGKSWAKTDTTFAHTGTSVAVSAPEYFGSRNSSFTTPLLDLSGCIHPIISFYYRNNGPLTSTGSSIVLTTSADGTTFTESLAKINANTSNQWQSYQLFLAKDVKYIRLELQSPGRGDNFYTYLDDIYVGEVPSTLCVSPQNPKISSTVAGEISLDWDTYGAATQWQINYGTPKYDINLPTDPNAIYMATSIHPITFSDLDDTTYHFRIRATCPKEKDTSSWTPFLSQKPLLTCPPVRVLNVQEVSVNSFKVKWSKAASETQYILELNSTQGIQNILVKDTVYTATQLTPNTDYTLRLRAYCGVGDSSKWISAKVKTKCLSIPEIDLPWSTGFESISVENQFPDCMQYTSHEWLYTNFPVGTYIGTNDNYRPRTGDKSAHFVANQGTNSKNEDYLWTPSFELRAGYNYRFSFWYAPSITTATNVYTLEAKMGTAASKEAMTIRIGDSIRLSLDSLGYRLYKADFTPKTNGTYYLGIHAITPDFNASALNIDDLSMERLLNCATPTEVKVGTLTATSAQLNWKSSASQWEIRYGKTDEKGFTEAAQTQAFVATTPQAALANLLPETQYGFQVRAICAEKDSSAWTVIQKFVTEASCPKPISIIAYENTDQSFKLQWIPKGSESQWELSLVEGRVANPSMPYILADSSHYTFTNLKPNRYYTVFLRASCSSTDHSYWLMDTVFTLCGAEALPYTESFETILKDGELPLCMETSSNLVRTKTDSVVGIVLKPRTGSKYIYYIAGSNDYIYTPAFALKAGQEYEFSAYWISADTVDKLALMYGNEKKAAAMQTITELIYKSSQAGYTQIKGRFTPTTTGLQYLSVYAQSGKGFLTIDDLGLKEIFTCDLPKNLRASTITTQSARLQWSSAADSFALSYRIKDSVHSEYTVINTKDTTYSLANLRDNTTYTWRVQSLCPFGNSEMVEAEFRTLKIMCVMPTQTSTSEITYDEARFTWLSEGTDFEVRFKASTDTQYRTETVANIKTLKVIALYPNTNYTWSVRNVCDASRQSEWTAALSFTTLMEPCQTPIALSNESIMDTMATISWASSASNFQVRYKKTSESVYTLQNVSAKQVKLNHLTANTAYTWAVRAICAANDTSAWAEDKFNTTPLAIEKDQASEIRVYSNHTNVYIHNPSQKYFQRIEVVNVAGQVLRRLGATDNTSIEIGSIKPIGIYVIRLISREGIQSYKLIIK
ncbi:MAG: fibronectin type III domain-containing protein, partial [Bacteroidales bacterium]